MMQATNIYQHKDRNGQLLSYGDKVIIKYHSMRGTSLREATIIGFTPSYVVLIWCPGSGNNMCRKSSNIIKINNPSTWKLY